MTDVAIPGMRAHDVTSDAARARIRARYRSERRFKAYGLIAIGLTAVFLVVVIADILVKGLPAFVQYRLLFDVNVAQSEVDPSGSKSPEAIRGGNFQALVREQLRGLFPDVKARADRRKLDGLLSSGAADFLRERVVADPALIGQTVKVPILLSADADLYYKGYGTPIVRRDGTGTATPSGTSGDITITSTADDFAQALAAIKTRMAQRALISRTEADRVRVSMRAMEATQAELERSLAAAKSANNPAQVAVLETRIASHAADLKSLTARVAELDARAAGEQAQSDQTKAAETLTNTLPSYLVAIDGGLVKVTEFSANRISGSVILPLTSTAAAGPGSWKLVTYETPEANRRLGDREVAWLEHLKSMGLVERSFNWLFFTAGDSREPELAGIRGALFGSALTLFVTLILCLPIGVAAAIYLEEFAPKNRVTELIEVNINNLAAVPSIVFGLLGLAVFLNFFGLPRSAPLVGGLVLALLVLPTIIIASRAALKAVPPSIKEAALGVGASEQQAIFHHVLPLAMPGIMTGTIIGMAHALGETAPLLMIGMVAFIVEVPTSITDAATVLPVQIFLWSDLPEIAFQSKTAAAIIVLLLFLFVMNGTAIVLRRRFERRW
jgi:phosphate transport system permease protein